MATAVAADRPGAASFGPERLTTWLASLVAIGGPLYALGLFVLSLQLRETYRMDWGAAWYAASLVSREVIVAVGIVQVQRGWPLLLISVVLAMYFAVDIRRRIAALDRPGNTARGWRRWLRIAWQILVGLLLAGLIALLGWLAYLSGSWPLVALYLFQLALGIVIGSLAALAAAYKRSIVAIAAGLFGTFCLALLITATMNADLGQPPLPSVELLLKEGVTARGALISHSGGYWHVLTVPGGTLVAYKDDEAKSVTIQPRPSSVTPPAIP